MSLLDKILFRSKTKEEGPKPGFIAKRNPGKRTFDKQPLGLSKSESPSSPEITKVLPKYSPKVRKDLELSSKEQQMANLKNNPPKVVKNLERMQPFIRRQLKTASSIPQVAKQARLKSARHSNVVIYKS